jgi:uncharacterized protein (TIGR04255 family)
MVRTLPDFADPPAVETAVGVRFAPIQGWNVFHYGLLLQIFREDYPAQQLRPPVGNHTISIPGPDEDFSGIPVRCWFINSENTELIQIQNDCFIRNWRKTATSPEYLHYDFIRPRFQRDWSKFRIFLDDNQLPAPDVWQCEVTYINQFVRGREWHDFKDLSGLYRIWSNEIKTPLLAQPQMAMFAAAFGMPNRAGTLQFVSQPGIRSTDGAEIIQLTVTALGRPRSSEEADILAWFDIGHAAVVQGFTDLTSEAAHAIWRIK